jgi:uncharacterized iron-regulated membrane protein
MPIEGFDRSWALAEQQTSGWESISMRVPAAADAPLIFTIDKGNGGQPQKRAQLTLNRETGEVIRWEPFSSYTTARKVRSVLRFAHTGEVAGVAGQAIAAMVSAGAAVLVWTGLALCWRRFRAWLKSRRATSIVGPAVAEVKDAWSDGPNSMPPEPQLLPGSSTD